MKEIQYHVVINREGQYSVWPAFKQLPQGWKAMGDRQCKSNCLSYIERSWLEIKPLSLLQQLKNE